MERPPASLTTLPLELISYIFALSSNPSLVLTSRALNQALAPLSKSVASRIQFLLIRYRVNYVKAVIKGLRWSFFDLDLLNGLDRIYSQERERIKEAEERRQRQQLAISSETFDVLLPSSSNQGSNSWQTIESPSVNYGSPSSSRASSVFDSPSLDPSTLRLSAEPPKKKRRKKYHVTEPERPVEEVRPEARETAAVLEVPPASGSTGEGSASISDREIPLPKDFPMPRRLFKSDKHMILIQNLLGRGASPSYPSHYPLVRASQRGDLEMVKMLLEAGAPPDQKAIRWACVEEHNEVLDVFLDRGVQPDRECLRWCVEKGKSKMIDRLLKLGVVPDLKTLIGF